MDSHALISLYHDTEKTKTNERLDKLPLILVVGREPSNEGCFVPSLGIYNFDHASQCAFWNESYAVIGKLYGMSGQELKSLCRRHNTSPVAFTDISPVLIRNSDSREARERLTTEQMDDHIKSMLPLIDQLDRVALVVLTGQRHGTLSAHAKSMFGYGASQLELAMKFRDVPSVCVPFMLGNNQRAILEVMREDKKALDAITSSVGALVEYDRLKAA